eukprot:GHRR01014445.1.p1 GENE.GHRR01014445.1~~GHRR01014445.1.p1  ORF type:complete len:110 (+),score=17.46 GHRR01014445.1:407-736(+)
MPGCMCCKAVVLVGSQHQQTVCGINYLPPLAWFCLRCKHSTYISHICLPCSLAEVVFALKRSPSYCLHGNADQQSCNDKSKLETIFNSASLNERAKFEKETFVKVGGKV